MTKTRLSSIAEESATRDSALVYRSPYEEFCPNSGDGSAKQSTLLPIGSKVRQRSKSLGRFFRKAFCGSCKTPERKFSNMSLDIPPYRGERKAIGTQPEASSQGMLSRASELMAGISGTERLMQTRSGSDPKRKVSQKFYSEAPRSWLVDQMTSGMNYPGPSTGAVPKTRARSVPARLEECKVCRGCCEQGGIIVEDSLFSQESLDAKEKALQANFERMISALPTPLFEKGTCPACCQKCRAEAAGVAVNEDTKSCCCRFEKAKCLLPDMTFPVAQLSAGAGTTPTSDIYLPMKDKSKFLRDKEEPIDVKFPPSTPERTSPTTYNLSPLAAGLKYERVRETTHGRAFTVSPKPVDKEKKTFTFEGDLKYSTLTCNDEEKSDPVAGMDHAEADNE